ncbi:hypothetical protein [Mycoplasmopsis felifaucium]|uniref:DUF3137 domain-containing protein n=1 Tax=Mycoplasmopsis felifaucium TaxID=35768 RepID=A0ABZ2RPY4_9BACT
MNANISMTNYDAVRKELDIQSKEFYDKLMKEKQNPSAKKAFIFKLVWMILFALVPLFLIVLISVNSVKNTSISENALKFTSWTFFGLIILVLLTGSYILTLYFGQKLLVKQVAYKMINVHKVLPSIFNNYGITLLNDPEETNNSMNESIYKTDEYVKNLYPNEADNIKITSDKAYVLKDNDTNDKWIIKYASVQKNNTDKSEHVLIFKGEIANNIEESFYGFYQGDLLSSIIKNENKEYKLINKQMQLFSTSNIFKDESIQKLQTFYDEYNLSSKNFGFNYVWENKKLYIWIKTSTKLFDVEKAPDVVGILFNHALLVSLIMQYTRALIIQ